MGRTCCVPYCKSGLRASKERKKFSLHSFPSDGVLKERWLRAISRYNFIPSKHSRVCSFHFLKSDFNTMRSDSNKWRKRGARVCRQLLKKNAIPSVFPNYPSYMQGTHSHERSNSSSSRRLQIENDRLEHDIEAFEEEDVVCDLQSLKATFLPSDFFLYPNPLDKSFFLSNYELTLSLQYANLSWCTKI